MSWTVAGSISTARMAAWHCRLICARWLVSSSDQSDSRCLSQASSPWLFKQVSKTRVLMQKASGTFVFQPRSSARRVILGPTVEGSTASGSSRRTIRGPIRLDCGRVTGAGRVSVPDRRAAAVALVDGLCRTIRRFPGSGYRTRLQLLRP